MTAGHPRLVRHRTQRLPADPGQLRDRGRCLPEELAALIERSRPRSAIYDVLVNGADVVVGVTTPAVA